jgi:hypothetical protein
MVYLMTHSVPWLYGIWWLVNNELERVWKELAMAYFKILFPAFAWETEENSKHFSYNSLSSDQELSPKPLSTKHECQILNHSTDICVVPLPHLASFPCQKLALKFYISTTGTIDLPYGLVNAECLSQTLCFDIVMREAISKVLQTSI